MADRRNHEDMMRPEPLAESIKSRESNVTSAIEPCSWRMADETSSVTGDP